jgi:2-oxoglutarate ferredoxin oxidoreductase subunit gamma
VQISSSRTESGVGYGESEVIIAEGEIDYPKTTRVDLLVALDAATCEKYGPELSDDGVMVVDLSERVVDQPANQLTVPIKNLARVATGSFETASLEALGVISGLTDIVTLEALIAVVEAKTPGGLIEMNREAVITGQKEGRKLQRLVALQGKHQC